MTPHRLATLLITMEDDRNHPDPIASEAAIQATDALAAALYHATGETGMRHLLELRESRQVDDHVRRGQIHLDALYRRLTFRQG